MQDEHLTKIVYVEEQGNLKQMIGWYKYIIKVQFYMFKGLVFSWIFGHFYNFVPFLN